MGKKLVIDCRFWGSAHTGLGRYTQSLVTSLHQLNPKHLEISLLVDKASQKKIKTLLPWFKTIACQSRYYSFKEQLEIPKIIKAVRPDLIHFLHFNVPLFTPKPFIVTIHDLIKHHSKGRLTTTHFSFIYPIKRAGYHLTVKQAVKRAKRILTPSQWVKQDILNHYQLNRQKIIITPESADPVFLKSSQKSTAPLKSDYLLYVGNAYPHKNVIQLIKAVKLYNQTYQSNLKLLIITARDLFYQRLRAQIKKLDALPIVKLKDYSSDKQLRAYYYHSKAFITASLFEGFGLPGLEAMASGTLVLAAKRASMPEVYQSHAYYFNPQDINDIVRQIKKVIDLAPSKRQIKIKQLRNHASAFSWEKTAKQTLKVYEDCLGLR